MGEQVDIHRRILSANSTGELMSVYDNWSEDYDKVLTEQWGYNSPQMAADLLAASIACDSISVLDAGCGTGLVGPCLKNLGAGEIIGIDYSSGMLEQARAKQVYTSLLRMDLNQRLDIPSDSFDAATCVGTFTSAHVQPKAVGELVRLVRPGGKVVFTVRDDYWKATSFIDLLVDLHKQGLAAIEQIRLEPYILSEGSECRFVVLGV